MSKRTLSSRQLLAGIAAVGLFAGGCENKSAQSQSGIRPDSQRALVPEESEPLTVTDPETAVPAFKGSTDPSLIATTVKNYAQRMAPLIGNRQKPADSTVTAKGESSDVEWLKPGQPARPVGRQPIPVEVVPLVQPVVDFYALM